MGRFCVLDSIMAVLGVIIETASSSTVSALTKLVGSLPFAPVPIKMKSLMEQWMENSPL